MKYQVIIQPRAFHDLDETFQRFAEDAPKTAARWLNGFIAALKTLAEHPHRCSMARENRNVQAEIRQLLYGKRKPKYRALFTIRERAVYVLCIRHAAQRDTPSELLES